MTAVGPARPLLTVKHAVPPARPTTVHRARLTDALDASTSRLATVVAPAGWGKTSLLVAWARARSTPVAWVSLDESDDDPVRFWSYVLVALGVTDAEIGREPLDELLHGAPDVALALLVNELAASTREHVLVLDDYHVLTDLRIHEGVEFLVTHLPPRTRVVMASRTDPPLPLARLRAGGELTELRAADLRFTLDEATALVEGVCGAPLDGTVAATAWGRTEGWAAGLQLTALALRGGGTAPARGGDHLLDYFATEVLPTLEPAQRELLVRTAPLEMLSGPLCDAVLGTDGGSAAVLAALERADLFVVALDDRREWYRCHHLLREALLRQPGGNAPDVLRRAASWFLDQGRRDDAVGHLLAAGDGPAAAAVLDRSERWFLDQGAAAGFVRLGEALDPATVGPGLALALAYGAAAAGRPDRLGHWLDVCDAGITDTTAVAHWHSARAAALTSRALLGVPDAESDRAVELGERALDLEGADGNPLAATGLGITLARAGRFDAAVDVLRGRWAARRDEGWPAGLTTHVAGQFGLCLLELGRIDELDRLLHESGPLLEDGGSAHPRAAGVLLHVVHARRRHLLGDDDRDALRRLTSSRLTSTSRAPGPSVRVLALIALADAELAGGDRVAARTALDRARDVADSDPPAGFVARRLDDAEARIGRRIARTAARSGELYEPLTDRELAVLRRLPGTASRRDIGAALDLSINTVKAYTAALYRKLGVSSRQDAVAVARTLGLI